MGTVEDRQARKAAQRNSKANTITNLLGRHDAPMEATAVLDPVMDAQGRLTGFARKTQAPTLPVIDGKRLAYLDACLLDYRNNGVVEAADVLRPALESGNARADLLSKCAYQLPPEAWGSRENVSNWIVRGGLHGRASAEQLIASMTLYDKPSVFVFVDWRIDSFVGEIRGAALAEDGTVLAGRCAPDPGTLREELMGGKAARHAYAKHYRNGNACVDLIGFTRAQLDGHAGFQTAILNYELKLKVNGGRP